MAQVGSPGEHDPGFTRLILCEIGSDPFAEAAGFADVQNGSRSVNELVDPRLVG